MTSYDNDDEDDYEGLTDKELESIEKAARDPKYTLGSPESQKWLEECYDRKQLQREERARERAAIEAYKISLAGGQSQAPQRTYRGWTAPTGPAKVKKTKPVKLNNPPKGEFILTLRRGDFAWKFQLISVPKANGVNDPSIRIQLWTWGEGGGFPQKGDPSYGFNLNMHESKKLVAALKNSLARIESGDFDPDDEKNITRWSKK